MLPPKKWITDRDGRCKGCGEIVRADPPPERWIDRYGGTILLGAFYAVGGVVLAGSIALSAWRLARNLAVSMTEEPRE